MELDLGVIRRLLVEQSFFPHEANRQTFDGTSEVILEKFAAQTGELASLHRVMQAGKARKPGEGVTAGQDMTLAAGQYGKAPHPCMSKG